MRVWQRLEPLLRAARSQLGYGLRHVAMFAALGLSCAPALGQDDPGFRVLEADSRLEDGVHRVDARIDYTFSEDAVEAMQNGVAITVSVRMQVLRNRPLFDETIAQVRARYRLQAHSLSERFVATNLSTDESKTFRSLDAMTRDIGVISNFPLLDDRVLESGQDYHVRLRATLDIESLPAPMRPLAYLSSSWRLSSDWTSWPLER